MIKTFSICSYSLSLRLSAWQNIDSLKIMSQTIAFSVIASGINGRVNVNISGTVCMEAINKYLYRHR